MTSQRWCFMRRHASSHRRVIRLWKAVPLYSFTLSESTMWGRCVGFQLSNSVTQLEAFSVWATLSNSLLMCAAPGCLSRKPALETVTGVTQHFMTVWWYTINYDHIITDDRWATYFLSFSHSIKCLLSAKERNGIVYPNAGARKSYGFAMTLGWVNHVRMFIFGWTVF